MYDFYAGFHALDRPPCETRREWDAKVEDARLASLGGEVDRPPAVFEQAARFGRDRASFLHFQLRTLLREEDGDPFYRLLTKSDKRTASTPPDESLAGRVPPTIRIRSVIGGRTLHGGPPRRPGRSATSMTSSIWARTSSTWSPYTLGWQPRYQECRPAAGLCRAGTSRNAVRNLPRSRVARPGRRPRRFHARGCVPVGVLPPPGTPTRVSRARPHAAGACHAGWRASSSAGSSQPLAAHC
ncbi:hypothetical protein FHU36_003954 [Nonomuraea muscovyensis]|uniref:Uncharacterized protein n=1 Tax=Nonomuraea muscovyensis TaxID=1124761 RepID=A0A7X0C2L5_9ACTN|nr:hypothetical protein [Nonomuraea muscovyensis]